MNIDANLSKCPVEAVPVCWGGNFLSLCDRGVGSVPVWREAGAFGVIGVGRS